MNKGFFRRTLGIWLSAALLFLPLHAQARDVDAKLAEAAGDYVFSLKPADIHTIKALLRKGAKANHTPDGSACAMMIAIQYRNPELVDLFLEAKTDVKSPVDENTGMTALMLALQNIGEPQVNAAEKTIVDSLLRAGSDLNAVTSGGVFPLKMAASGGSSGYPHPDMVELLLKAGARADLKTPDGETALTSLAAGNLIMLKMLLAAGTDPYTAAKTGFTPLHYVCMRSSVLKGKPDKDAAERIKLLMKSADSLNTPPTPERLVAVVGVPLMDALESNNPDCARAMIAAGAKLDSVAYSDAVDKTDPSVKGLTVRQAAKKNRQLIDPETAKLLE